MENIITQILSEYESARNFKASLGEKGMYEQNRINERFFVGDQWYGAQISGDKPLVRHNIIKRIGDYKIGQLLSGNFSVFFFGKDISCTRFDSCDTALDKESLVKGEYNFSTCADQKEVRLISESLSDYLAVCQKNLKFREKCVDILKNSFITGTGVLYSYWDTLKNDVACEVLPVDNLYLGDGNCEETQKQPYIIITARTSTALLKEMAKKDGRAEREIASIVPDSSYKDKTTLYTKLYKKNGNVYAVSVTEKAVVRREYNTHLTRYPVSIFCWEKRESRAYGQSEITHLIPNQIAINRMLTASVWASMTMGMPIMTVNGDTVTADITNEPGQIIKVYGTSDDIKNAINYVTPPDFSANFKEGVDSLINGTLESSGAILADPSKVTYNNTVAIEAVKNSSVSLLFPLLERYEGFLKDTALILLDFWINKYGKRQIRIEDTFGRWYLNFDAHRYKNVEFCADIKKEEENFEGN